MTQSTPKALIFGSCLDCVLKQCFFLIQNSHCKYLPTSRESFYFKNKQKTNRNALEFLNSVHLLFLT